MGRFSRAARAAIAPAARARKLRLETLMDLHLGSELTFAFWAKGFYASVSPASIAFPAGHVEQLDDRKARRALRLGYNAANREPREKMIFFSSHLEEWKARHEKMEFLGGTDR